MKKIFVAILLASVTLGCHTITTSVEIHAPASEVWRVIVDTHAYPEWNSFLKVEGDLAVGNTLHITVSPPEKDPMSFDPKVLRFSNKELLWRGRFFMPGLFTGDHHFYLEEKSAGVVVFHQNEDFSGILVPFVDLEATKLGFENMNRELKDRVEKNKSR